MQSNNLNITFIYNKINFVQRYQKICEKYNDFENRLRDNKPEIYSNIIKKFGYKASYYKGETFYRIEENVENIIFGIQFTLKHGIVEIMLDTKFKNQWCVPDGRIDFMCKEIDENFDREKYNLPKYKSYEELEEILIGIFSIYEDFKLEFLKEYNTK